jgi:uroporphyrinogen decarboxylase
MKRKDSLSGRERVRLALEHTTTDRIPIALVCAGINPPAMKDLESYLGRERRISAAEYLDPIVDIVQVDPAYIGPPLLPGTDVWGVRRRGVSYGAGSYDEIEHYPLASIQNAGELSKHLWPDPDWFDYGTLPDRIRAARSASDKCVMVWNGNIFETSWYMRGFQQMLMDVMLDEEMVRGIMSRVTEFYVSYFTRVLSAARGGVDLIFTADDIGDQRGLLMPMVKWETLIKPFHKRLNAAMHEFGAKVIYHSDGAVMDAVGGLIDMGIDVLQALQFSAAGMDPLRLKSAFGDRLCFAGGVSVQTTLPFGSPDNVRKEVEERIRVLGRDGGYILGPSHYIQAGTPARNIVAMFDAALRYYPF